MNEVSVAVKYGLKPVDDTTDVAEKYGLKLAQPETQPQPSAEPEAIPFSFEAEEGGVEPGPVMQTLASTLIRAPAIFTERMASELAAGLPKEFLEAVSPEKAAVAEEVFRPRNLVEKVAGVAGSFAGFVGGLPMAAGEATTKLVLKAVGEESLQKLLKKSVGRRFVRMASEALSLGTASAFASNEGLAELLTNDKEYNSLADELYGRAVSFASGAVSGGGFSAIREFIKPTVLRAAANYALLQGVGYTANGQWSPIENNLFDALLSIWFAKNKAAPTVKQRAELREFADSVIESTMRGKEEFNVDVERMLKRALKQGKKFPTLPEPVAETRIEGDPLARLEELKGQAGKMSQSPAGNWDIGARRPFAFDPNSTEDIGRFRLAPLKSIVPGSLHVRKSKTKGVSFTIGKNIRGKEVVIDVRFDKKVMPETRAAEWWERNKGRYKFYGEKHRIKEPTKEAVTMKLLVEDIVNTQNSIDDKMKAGDYTGITDLVVRQQTNINALDLLTGKTWDFNPSDKKNPFKVISKELPKELADFVSSKKPEPSEPNYLIKKLIERDERMKRADAAIQGLGLVYTPPSPERIVKNIDMVLGPEFVLRKRPHALKLASSIIEGESFHRYVVNEHYSFFDKVRLKYAPIDVPYFHPVAKARSKALVSAIEDLYELRNLKEDSPRAKEIREARKKNPRLYLAAHDIVNWFAGMREKIKDYKREVVRKYMGDTYARELDVITSVLKEKERVRKITKATKATEAKTVSLKELVDKAADKNGWSKKQKAEFADILKEYMEIDFWGLNDYVTKIERGTWKVIDQNGDVRAIGLTRDQAVDKARELAGSTLKRFNFKVVNEYSRIDPTVKTKWILKGEPYIFDALKSYAYAVEKKMILDPLRFSMEVEFSKDPTHTKYTPEERRVLKRQLTAFQGTYPIADQIVDSVVEALGKYFPRAGTGRPFRYTRFTGRLRWITGILKLGYRPAASLVNLYGGHKNIITKTGFGYWRKGIAFLKTEEGKKFIRSEAPYMGLTMTEYETFSSKAARSIFNPLYLFQLPERNIRRVAMAANYLMLKDGVKKNGFLGLGTEKFDKPLSNEEAILMAHRAMRMQAFMYNASALPGLLRSPTGKFIGMFKSFLVQEGQFVATLGVPELARYMTMMVALGGPSAVLALLRSIPFLEAFGVTDKLDEAEKMLLSSKGGRVTLYGLPGTLGFDISISSIPQLPQTPREFVGPVISDINTAYKMLSRAVRVGAEKGFGLSRFKEAETAARKALVVSDYLDEFAVQAKGITDILSAFSTYQPETGKLWVRDMNKRGRLAYPLTSPYEVVALALGAKPLSKARYQTAIRILERQRMRTLEKAQATIEDAVKVFNENGFLSKEYMENLKDDLLNYGVWDEDALIRAITNTQYSPEQRLLIGERWIDKIRNFELLDQMEYYKILEDASGLK